MEMRRLKIGDYSIPVYVCNTLVIGSGAASLNCADHLYSFGVKDLLIVTEELGGGTSNRSGSDKQTYYKLSLFGDSPDSTYEMARTLFAGGCMHGDIALIEATTSAQEFYHLVHIGVPFPPNYLGGYVGYKTDHDPRQRATSAGPWTSNQMFGKLLEQVRGKGIEILDRHEVISLITTDVGDERRVIGAIALNKALINSGLGALVFFQAENVVMGTGGPGGLYSTSVYPEGHLGSTGIAVEAGAQCVNLTEWQYGLASTKFRWNLSGTYQQVIPRYISTEQDGSDEREFLNDYFPFMGKLASSIFLKGYQWPFDPRKIENLGSSMIDVLVYYETVIKGRRVFLDFTRNPSGAGRLSEFSFSDLEPEAYEYLEKSGALFGTPIERLLHMNRMSVELYEQNGIDITSEPLEIAVCAQHNNGGLRGNIWWESNIKHLFPVGEVNGTHGVYRPGGSALNSGQCGGYRAAQYIAAKYTKNSMSYEDFVRLAEKDAMKIAGFIQRAIGSRKSESTDCERFRNELQARMTRVGAHIRRLSDVSAALEESKEQLRQMETGSVCISCMGELVTLFQNRQLCFAQIAVLESIKGYLERGGGSRGSYMVMDDDGIQVHPALGEGWKMKPEDESLRQVILQAEYDPDEGFILSWSKVRPIPEDAFWFENVWNEYVGGTEWMDRD